MDSGDWRTQPQSDSRDMIVNQTTGIYADSTARTEQANVDDWQEEVYQKIKAMKEMYLPELNEMYQKIATKLQQQSSLPQQPRSEQLDKLKIFKTMLERIIPFLQVSKSNILPGFKEKLGSYEKQIMNFIRTNRPRTPAPIMQQGQLPPPNVELMQQQQTQPQINQVQSRENQTNLQQQSVNLQGSMPAMQQNIMTNLEHSAMCSLPFASMSQPTMMGSLQPGSNLDSVQGNALSSLQQVTRSLQQIRLSAPQQANMDNMQSQASWLQLQHPQFQQQPNSLQRDTQQQMQASAPLDSIAYMGQVNGGDWQEEVFQKIKSMKELYLPELNEMYQKIATKVQQQSSLPQQSRSEQLDKLKIFKTMLERIITFLQVSKSNILPGFKERLGSYEKQIMNFIRTNRPRTPAPIMQQGQLPPRHVELMQQQQQQTQPHINQVQSRENQTNLQQQSVNLQGSMPAMQQNIMTSLEHSSMSSLPFASMSQPTMMGSLQPGSNLDSVQGNALSSLQQVTRSLQQIRLSAPQQANMDNMQSQASWLQLQHPQFQQQPNSLQRDTQQQMQASAPLDSIAYTGQVNGGDWQEEVFQKIKAMKEMYLPEMNETYQKICAKLQQLDSLPRQPTSAELDYLKILKSMSEHIISFLQVSKSDIPPGLKEKLGSYEEEIRNFISCNRA